MPPAPAVLRQDLRLAPKDFLGQQNQIVEVDAVNPVHVFMITSIDFAEEFGARFETALLGEALRFEAGVFA